MSLSTEYTGVIPLASRFVAVHITGGSSTLLSDPEEKLITAQEIAKAFARQKQITYNSTLVLVAKPLLTIFKEGVFWYPIEVYPDKIKILDRYVHFDQSGKTVNIGFLTSTAAMQAAEIIAKIRGYHFEPFLGLSLGK